MTDLVAWLRARLDEDEQRARKDLWVADRASAGAWQAWAGHNVPHSELRVGQQRIAEFTGPAHDVDAMLAQRFKPANVRDRAEAVLRRVDAMRRIVDTVIAEIDADRTPAGRGNRSAFRHRTLRLLALQYADRDGYREEWRP